MDREACRGRGGVRGWRVGAWRARKLSRAGFTLAASLLDDVLSRVSLRAAHDRGPSLARRDADRLQRALGVTAGADDRLLPPSSEVRQLPCDGATDGDARAGPAAGWAAGRGALYMCAAARVVWRLVEAVTFGFRLTQRPRATGSRSSSLSATASRARWRKRGLSSWGKLTAERRRRQSVLTDAEPRRACSAGVVGLTTALQLSANNRYSVTVVAKHMPGDYDIEYASPWAGANYLP